MASTPGFDYAEQQRIIDAMRTKSLFFIAGLPKSGTTWVTVSLNAHPEISCQGEGHFVGSLAPKLFDALERHNKVTQDTSRIVLQDHTAYPKIDGYDYRFLMASAILLLMGKSEKARAVPVVGEKTPDNVVGLTALAELFPGAKFLYVNRDPRDCAVSSWFHNMRINPKDALRDFPTFAKYVPHLARMWVNAVTRWERYVATGASPCAMVRYEDVAARPEAEMARLFEFLGVTADRETVARCVTQASFANMSGGRQAGKEDRSSLLRKGVPSDWLNHFTQADATALEDIAGEAMAKYGYLPHPARADAVPPQPPVLAPSPPPVQPTAAA